MIWIKNIREVKKGEYDEVWAIVRSFKNPSDWMIHVPELSPSYNLFLKYLDLKNNGSWNQQAFDTIYTPQFLKEMNEPIAKAKLAELIQKDKEGKNIALVCFCPNPKTCHRSLIANILKEANVNINI
jgi:uncharacterized protein YeaO (DUF488 family)